MHLSSIHFHSLVSIAFTMRTFSTRAPTERRKRARQVAIDAYKRLYGAEYNTAIFYEYKESIAQTTIEL